MTDSIPDETWVQLVRVGFTGPADQLKAFHDWYDNVHIPAMVATPGIRSCARYGELGSDNSFLAVWEVDNLEVYEHPVYLAARGWGEFAANIEWCTVGEHKLGSAVRKFGTAADG